MKIEKIISLIFFSVLFSLSSKAQENAYPALPQSTPVYLVNATIHIGNGEVINKGAIGFANGKLPQ